jgi:hypothetical protein
MEKRSFVSFRDSFDQIAIPTFDSRQFLRFDFNPFRLILIQLISKSMLHLLAQKPLHLIELRLALSIHDISFGSISTHFDRFRFNSFPISAPFACAKTTSFDQIAISTTFPSVRFQPISIDFNSTHFQINAAPFACAKTTSFNILGF